MMSQNNKYLFVFLLVLSFLSLGIIYLLLSNIKPAQETTILPTPTVYDYHSSTPETSSYKFSPFQKTVIGKTSDKEIDSLTSIISKEASSDGTITYLVKSVNSLQPDKVITKNGAVIYEDTSSFTDALGGFPKTASYMDKFGNPEKKIDGSEKYGPFVSTYIYAEKGFSLIGNPNTDEVYEIQRFLPMPIVEYLNKYGSGIGHTTPGPENF